MQSPANTATTPDPARRAPAGRSLSGSEILKSAWPGSVVVYTQTDAERVATYDNLNIATVSAGSPSAWRPEFADLFVDHRLVILTHRDSVGLALAARVARDSYGKALAVKIVRLPGLDVHEGVADWIARGGNRQTLNYYMDLATDWHPRPPDEPSLDAGQSSTTASPDQLEAAQATPAISPALAVLPPEDEIEGIVALNRILDAVKCPANCRSYPFAVISAFYQAFKSGSNFDEFLSFVPSIGGYLPGKTAAARCSKTALLRRAQRAAKAFDQWQCESGYYLVSRHRNGDNAVNLQSLYRVPLIAVWSQVLDLARQNPRWGQGQRKRAQAIRKAANQLAPQLQGLPNGAADAAEATGASQPVSASSQKLRAQQGADRRLRAAIEKSFQGLAQRRSATLALAENARQPEAALIIRDSQDLAEVALNAIWVEFNRIVTPCLLAATATDGGTTPSPQSIFLAILEPYFTGQSVT